MKRAIELHANGKLLITGEYLVLVGAKALAMPVRFGQRMLLQETTERTIDWVSLVGNVAWFSVRFDPDTLKIIVSDKKTIAGKLMKVLKAARRINPAFLTGPAGWKVRVTANYPLEWGLGSSSSLYFLVASWAGIPVYDLYRQVSQGSGYDIACAGRSGLIYYQLRKGLPEFHTAIPGKALRAFTYFAYLGNKQDSSREVAAFLLKTNYTEIDLVAVSDLSVAICEAESVDDLTRLVVEHEYIISTILKKDPIASRFSSFDGAVKSLGAWGGDFAMFVSGREPRMVMQELKGLGLNKVFRYNDLEI